MKRIFIPVALLVAALAIAPLTAGAQGMAGTPDARQQQMLEHMKAMQSQMAKIRQTTDADARSKLMAEHMKSMQEGMQMMRGMEGG